jgi:uncharacterized RmlC-like cupin family protein
MTEKECRAIRGTATYEGKQQLSYGIGISAQSANSCGLCLHTLEIPPGGRAKAHLHENHESAIYLISGRAEMWWGEQLSHHEVLSPGDFVYIPPGVPHLPGNPSRSEPAKAVVARTDPDEQESVVLRPDLDLLVD